MGEVMEDMLTGLAALDDFLRLCYQESDRVWMTRAQAAQAHQFLQTFFEHYHAAARRCCHSGQLFFNLTPKYHYLMHMQADLANSANQAYLLNPACFATQMDEDYVGVVSQMGRSCHPLGVSRRTAEKWLVYAWLKWQQ